MNFISYEQETQWQRQDWPFHDCQVPTNGKFHDLHRSPSALTIDVEISDVVHKESVGLIVF